MSSQELVCRQRRVESGPPALVNAGEQLEPDPLGESDSTVSKRLPSVKAARLSPDRGRQGTWRRLHCKQT